MNRRALLLLAVVTTVAAGSAGAQAAEGRREAKAHAERALRQYNLGNFEGAITEYGKAYEIDPSPIFLFNLGQAQRHTGNLNRAIFFFRRYLNETEAGAANRGEAERYIHELEEKEAAETAAKEKVAPAAATPAVTSPTTAGSPAQPAPNLTAPPPPAAGGPTLVARAEQQPAPDAHAEDRPLVKKWWFWTIVGVVVAAGVIGVVSLTGGGSNPGCPAPYRCTAP